MDFKDTRDKLQVIITELSGAGQLINVVYGYQPPSVSFFPYAVIKLVSGSVDDRLTTLQNFTKMTFVIRVLLTTKNTLENEDLRLDIIDAIVAKLRTSSNVDTLGNTVEKFDIANITVYDTDSGGQPMVGFDVEVNAYKVNSIS